MYGLVIFLLDTKLQLHQRLFETQFELLEIQLFERPSGPSAKSPSLRINMKKVYFIRKRKEM